MSYQSNQTGSRITLNEQLALSQLAELGSPGQVLTVNQAGTGLEYTTVSGGSGYQIPLTGVVDGSNTIFTWATAPNVLMIDRVPTQKTSSDGTVNWSGTTTTVLTTIPFDDLFAVA